MTDYQPYAEQVSYDEMDGRFLTFVLDDELYGLEIRYVTEIIGMQPVNPIPETPDYIKGVINLRGKIIPVVDMRLKFKKAPAEYTDRTCIIIIDTEELLVGLIVERVSEVMNMDENDIAPPPHARTGIKNKYLRGISKTGGKVTLLLDCEKLFTEQETQEIEHINLEAAADVAD